MSAEHVIALFTDIVGSTELSVSRSPEEADQVRRRHFSVLRRAIAATDGHEAKNLGDGLMVVFDSASSAIACAVAMQQSVAAEAVRGGVALSIRVGLSGGEVTREGDDYFGDPVVEAARLCGACNAGQILASDVVRLIAGRRSAHEVRSVGPLTLKGLPAPVVAVEILWEPSEHALDAEVIPLPHRLVPRPEASFAGRRAEMATLIDSLARERAASRPAVVLITGEAGLGKTTLAFEAARAAHENGACVLFGHCEQELATPYQLFSRALEHYVRHAPEAHLRDHVAEHGSAIVRLAPSLARRIPDLPPTRATDPDSERFLLFAAVVGLLVDISSRSVIVAVLDDVQWADEASLALLRHLAATDQPIELLVIATGRDNELASSPALIETIGALQRLQSLTRLDLTGLEVDDVTSLMQSSGFAIDDPAHELAAGLSRETDGNPFFVLEVLRHLVESGLVAAGPEGYVVSAGTATAEVLPSSLVDVIEARLARLGSNANRILSIAAVIGREFTVDLLAKATTEPIATVLDVLDDAAMASLVRESTEVPGRFGFAHALIQHALYERLSLSRRALAHREVALATEALFGEFRDDLAIGLARHWASTARAEDAERAIRYSCLAGDVALRALSPADALRLYEQALALIERPGGTDDILEIDVATGLGTAQRQTGNPAFRETLLDAARRAAHSSETARLVRAVLANSRGWYSASGLVDWDKVSLLELALDRLPASGRERALVLATLCSELAFSDSLGHRLALAEEALSMARAENDEATLVRILNLLVFPHLVPSLLERSLEWSAEALERAERVGDPLLLFSAALYRATVATRAGEIAEVDRCLGLASELVAELNQPSLNWEYTFHRAKRAQIAGHIEEAELLASTALQIGTECGEPDAATFFGVQYAVVAWQNGTMDVLAPIIEEMIAENPGLPTIRASLAMAYGEGGHLDECRGVLRAFADNGYELRADTAWINGMTEYAEAAINLGEAEFCEALYDRLAPWSAQFSSAGGLTAEGPVSLVLGGLATVLERYDDAAVHLDAALEFTERNGAWFFAARAALLYGQLLAARGVAGEAARAHEYLRRAQSLAATRGYAGVERRASALLEALR